jgi:predicted nucleic acid-binding Zn ribbon protein
VFGDWPRLVGPKIAAHATPVELVGGRLVVRADDPVWANQLRWLEQDLVARLGDQLGAGVVTAVEVRVGAEARGARGRGGGRRRR